MTDDNTSDLRTDTREHFVLDAVCEALQNTHPNNTSATYDDPEFVEAVADHAAYRSTKTDTIDDMTVPEARDIIDRLIAQGELRVVTDDLWLDDKVTLAPKHRTTDDTGEEDVRGHCYWCGGPLPDGGSIKVQVNEGDPKRETCAECFRDWPPDQLGDADDE